jgi:hypothetical protein
MLSLLPDALQYSIAQVILADSALPALFALSCTGKVLRSLLEPLRAEANKRRLRWDRHLTIGHKVDDTTGTSIVMVAAPNTGTWAAGPTLPASGQTRWVLRVSLVSGNQKGFVGICSARGDQAWGVNLQDGKLQKLQRVDSTVSSVEVSSSVGCTAYAVPNHSEYIPGSDAITCYLHADLGIVLFCLTHSGHDRTFHRIIRDDRLKNVELRPCARLYARRGDSVSFAPRNGRRGSQYPASWYDVPDPLSDLGHEVQLVASLQAFDAVAAELYRVRQSLLQLG